MEDTISISDCLEILRKHTSGEVCQVINFELTPYKSSLGTLGESKSLSIQYKCKNTVSEVTFFVKTLPTKNKFQELYIKTTKCFYKEIKFFNEIYPKLLNVDFCPKFYYSKPTLMILEDLYKAGYQTHPQTELFNLGQCKAALKSLAVFHASALMYEHNLPQPVNELHSDFTQEALYLKIANFPGYLHLITATKALKGILDNYFKTTKEETKNEIIQYFLNMTEYVKPSLKFKNVLNHGDIWCNNIMFKQVNDSEYTSKIVDFQLLRYNPPSLDVLMLIHLNTNRSFQNQHLNELLKYYFDHLTTQLENYNLKYLLDWNEFKLSMKETYPTSVAFAPLFLHYVLIPEKELMLILADEHKLEHFMTVNRTQLVLNSMENSTVYNSRLRESLQTFVDWFENEGHEF